MLKVACVGAGYFSQFHYDAWSRLGGVELVGAADQELAKANAMAETYDCNAYNSLERLLEAEQPDIVDIIVPPPGHLTSIESAISANVQAIICQKPFCTSPEDARKAVELADRAGVPLIVHENFRFQPWYRTIKEAIDTGKIGEIHQLTFRLRSGDGRGPDAYLNRQPYFQKMPRFLVHETAVHWIDTFRFLLGEPHKVFADLRRMNPVISGEDAGYILFFFDKGVRALFDGNRHLDHVAENKRLTMGECEIEGTEGTIALYGDGSTAFRAFGASEWASIAPAEEWQGFGGDSVFALQKHIVDALQGHGTFENRATDYLRNQVIEEAIYQSADTGCSVAV